MHDGEPFSFFLLDAKPARAVHCVAAAGGFLEMELDFVQPIDFAESAEALAASSGDAAAAFVTTGSAMEGERCPHCRRTVPSASAALHQAGCARRNVFCEECDVVVEKNVFAEHCKTEHAFANCNACSVPVKVFRMKIHFASECKERKVGKSFGYLLVFDLVLKRCLVICVGFFVPSRTWGSIKTCVPISPFVARIVAESCCANI